MPKCSIVKRHSAERNSSGRLAASGALERVLDVLESVVKDGADTTLAAIAAQTDLPKPTAHRILMGLACRSYVRSWEHGHYGPGPQLFVLAGMANAVRDYAVIARPTLRELRNHTDDTIHLALLVGDEAVYIEKLEGNRSYQSASKVGLRLSLHCTAIGKAILAALADSAREELLERLALTRRTRRTLTELPALRAELALTRRRRFGLDDEENEEGMRCVGAAFRDHNNVVVGAISISAPAFLMSVDQATALAPAVLEAADGLSRALGAPADSPCAKAPTTALEVHDT